MKNSFYTVLLTSIVLALAAPAWGAEDTNSVAGKWKTEFDSPVGTQKYTYEFKVDGQKVTGKARGVREDATNEVEIIEGKLDKD